MLSKTFHILFLAGCDSIFTETKNKIATLNKTTDPLLTVLGRKAKESKEKGRFMNLAKDL